MVAVSRVLLAIAPGLFLTLPVTAALKRVRIAAPIAAINGLLKRQTPSIPLSNLPTECQPTCASILDALNSCPDDSCFCTNTNMNSFASCLNCAVNTLDSVLTEASAQNSLDKVVALCNDEGFKVKPVKVGSAQSVGPTSSAGSISSTRPAFSSSSGSILRPTFSASRPPVTVVPTSSIDPTPTTNPPFSNGAVRSSTFSTGIFAVGMGIVLALL